MAAKKKATREEPVSREQILLKYWELANLDPEITKGTIAGQLKALDSLFEELRAPANVKESDRVPGAKDIYRAAWMRDHKDER